MANRNVDLLIRARDNASRAFKSVSDALDELGAVQEGVAAKTGKVDTALNKSQSAAAKAGKAIGNDLAVGVAKADKIFERIEKTVTESTAQFDAQKAQLTENKAAYAALEAQAESAGAAIRRSEDQIGPQTEEQTARLKAMNAGYRDLERQIKKLTPSLARQEQNLESNAVELDRIRNAAVAASTALRQVNSTASQSTAQTASLAAKARAEQLATAATQAHGRAMATLEASYARQRAAARPSIEDQNKLAASFRKSFSAANAARGPFQQVAAEIARIGPNSAAAAAGMNKFNREMLNGRRAFGAFYGDSRKALSLMQRIRGEALSLTAQFVGFYAVFNIGQEIFSSFSKLEAAQNRLGAAFNQDYSKVNDEMARLQDEAARLGISFDTLSDNYSKFIISGQQAGLSVEDLRKTFTQVAESGRVLKLSNDQIEGTFNALIQIAGKGTLQMEELRQQLGDRIPGAVGIMAKALGYGTDELAQFYKDVENGAVSADDALVAFGNGLEDTFGDQLEDALDSTITKVGALQNLLFQRQITAAEGGFIDGLDRALDSINEFLASDEGIQFFEDLGAAFGKLFSVIPFIIDNMDALTALFKGFVALKVGQTVAQLVSNFSGLSKATVAQMRVQVAMNRAIASTSPAMASALRSTTALGAGLRGLTRVASIAATTIRTVFLSLGGIIGIAAAALTLFTVNGLGGVDDAADITSATLDEHANIVRKVKAAYDDAGGSADTFAEKLENLSKIEAEANLKKLRDQLKAFQDDDSNTFNTLKGSGPETRARLQLRGDDLGVRELVDNMLAADKAFTRGEGSARDLLEAIQAINEEAPDFLPIEIQQRIEQIAKEGIAMEEGIASAEAVLRVMNGTATEADNILLGLVEQTKDVAEAAKESADQYDEFKQAMQGLAAQVPSLNAAMKELDAIGKIEASFQEALKAANALPDAIMRIAAAQEALDTKNLALQGLDAQSVAGFNGTDGAQVSAQVIREFEGFRQTPYWDVNALRAGYGSDTVTLSDGTIQKVTKGTSVSVADANRDLLRRVNSEFLPKARNQVGAERFDSFNAQQQAALTSIAYNYGELPGRIINAVRTGTKEQAAAAIRGLGSDNEGINRKRRNREAALFESNAGEGNAIKAQETADAARVKAAEDLAAKQAEYRAKQAEGIAQTQFEASLEGKRLIDAEVAKAIREAENEAKKVGLTLSTEERNAIEAATRAKFAGKQADEDRNVQLERAKELEEAAALLVEKRRFLQEQITQMEASGDMVGVARTQEELEAVEMQLETALEKARAFWEALGGAGADSAILKLQTTQQELRNVESTAITSGKAMNTMIADKLTSALDSFAQKIANGEDAITALRDVFLQMAAEILREIGLMIIKQLIFNAISGLFGGGAGGGGGLGGLLAGGINGIFHKGGVATGNSQKSSRAVSPAVFANAQRYHSGGIAGLAPDEMGAILKKNEEVLTEQDPRHRFNGGAAAAAGGGAGTPMTIINAFDAPGFLEQAIAEAEGGNAVLNWLKANSDEVKAAIG